MKLRWTARCFLVIALLLLLGWCYLQHMSLLPSTLYTVALLGGCALLDYVLTHTSLERLKQVLALSVFCVITCVGIAALLRYMHQTWALPWGPSSELILCLLTGFSFFLLLERWIRHTQAISIKTRPLLVTPSALSDRRLYDIAALGLFDDVLCVPSFILDPDHFPYSYRLYQENIKQLQALPHLHLRIAPVMVLQGEESEKMVQAAKFLEADLLAADQLLSELAQKHDLKLISLQALATALKPAVPQGESLKVKIQRLGKEADQGIGYLEDGTMVVVNGAGKHVGECVLSQVLSVRQTTTGRMIFCNLCAPTI